MNPAIRQVPRMSGIQNENGPATAPTVPSHGSNIPHKETKMNSTENSTAAPIASSSLGRLPGTSQRDDIVFEIANLGSLFTVCALALNDADDWSDEIRKRVTQDIKFVLEWGARHAEDVGGLADRELRDRA